MTLKDYYEILGIPLNSSTEEIKKAYRVKARLYHPDINPAPDAKDKFINATVAYEFLITFHEKINNDDEAYKQAMEDWRKYRQDRSNKRAKVYARTSYTSFKNTKFYKTTRILDRTSIVITFAVSIMILVYTIYGYSYRLKHPDPILGKPSVFTFIMLILLSLLFLAMSVFYLRSYRESIRKKKRKS